MAKRAFGTLLQRASKPCATRITGGDPESDKNSILWTAVEEGLGGNSIYIEIIDPEDSAELAVAVDGSDITITLAHDGEAVTSIASEVASAVAADGVASLLVIPTLYQCDGSGLMVAEEKTALTGGTDELSYTTIAFVGDLSGPSLSKTTIPTTHQQSPQGWQESMSGAKDIGEVSAPINFTPDAITHGHVLGLVKDFRYEILRKFKMIFPTIPSKTWEFDGHITTLNISGPMEGKLSAAISWKLTGKPTLA